MNNWTCSGNWTELAIFPNQSISQVLGVRTWMYHFGGYNSIYSHILSSHSSCRHLVWLQILILSPATHSLWLCSCGPLSTQNNFFVPSPPPLLHFLYSLKTFIRCISCMIPFLGSPPRCDSLYFCLCVPSLNYIPVIILIPPTKL